VQKKVIEEGEGLCELKQRNKLLYLMNQRDWNYKEEKIGTILDRQVEIETRKS
jgi:hypothetical protein